MAEVLSTRATLRCYQRARAELDGGELDQALQFLQAKDLDLSVRHGALMAVDGLLAASAINPIAASPGAPLSLNPAEQPWEVVR